MVPGEISRGFCMYHWIAITLGKWTHQGRKAQHCDHVSLLTVVLFYIFSQQQLHQIALHFLADMNCKYLSSYFFPFLTVPFVRRWCSYILVPLSLGIYFCFDNEKNNDYKRQADSLPHASKIPLQELPTCV